MTELKIKQADINNNGNQRLMGKIRGGGRLKICIVFGGGCTHTGGRGADGGSCSFFVRFLFPL